MTKEYLIISGSPEGSNLWSEIVLRQRVYNDGTETEKIYYLVMWYKISG